MPAVEIALRYSQSTGSCGSSDATMGFKVTYTQDKRQQARTDTKHTRRSAVVKTEEGGTNSVFAGCHNKPTGQRERRRWSRPPVGHAVTPREDRLTSVEGSLPVIGR